MDQLRTIESYCYLDFLWCGCLQRTLIYVRKVNFDAKLITVTIYASCNVMDVFPLFCDFLTPKLIFSRSFN